MPWAIRLLRSVRAGERIVLLVGLFVSITLFIVFVTDVRTGILDAVRAYVSGEALWSKAQKEAVNHLARYAETRSEADFERYQHAIRVPLGDRAARLELEKETPDLDAAREGFLQGRNHPDDIPGLISLFRRFRHMSFIDEAVSLWTAGDELITELQERADALRAEVRSARPRDDRIAAIVEDIGRIDEELRPLEDGFSTTLGEGGRWASVWLTRAVYGAAALLLAILVLLSRRMLRAERRERETAALTRAVVDEALDCIISADREGRILDFNPVAERTFGWTREEVVGRTVAETVVPPALREAHVTGLRNYAAKGRGDPNRRFELTAMRKDGSEFPVELTVTAIDRGSEPIFAAHIRDLTERKQAEEAGRESEARRRAESELREVRRFVERVANTTPDIFYLVDLREARLLYVNRQLTSILGYKVEEIENADMEFFWTRFHPEDVVQVPNLIASAFSSANDQVIAMEFRFKDAAGNWRWLHSRNIIFSRDSSGRPIQVLGTAQDLTERKRADDLAQQHEAALAHVQRVSTLGEIATGLAHELNQPLAAIVSFARGCSRRMRSGTVSMEELLPVVDQIGTEALRAGDFIRHLRALASKQQPEREIVDVNDMVRALGRLVAPEARRLGMSIKLDLDPGAPMVHAHRIQIDQVVLNLIRNGFDAMRDPTLGPRVVSIRTVAVEAGGAMVAVSDAGPGIKPEVALHVFDPFFTTKSDGMGMGLAISRSIVEAHGGHIAVNANEDRGTTFWIELPYSNEDVAEPGDSAAMVGAVMTARSKA